MKAPIFTRPLSDDERRQIKAGLHSADAFVLRRCQIVLDSEQRFWTLEAVAQVSFEQGLIAAPTSVESMRRALQRLGTNWIRAKHWISSPDPQYQRKKPPRPLGYLGEPAAGLCHWICRRGLVESVCLAGGLFYSPDDFLYLRGPCGMVGEVGEKHVADKRTV
jgi:hypothetical protein